jgi:hypothetical protein
MTSQTFEKMPGADLEQTNLIGLVKHLMEEVASLFRQELSLAIAQLTVLAGKLTAGVLSLAAGAAVLLAGFLVLLASAVLGLTLLFAPWLAALIVGAAVTLVGMVLVVAGYKAVNWSELQLPHSQESLRKDKKVLTRSAS